MDSVFDSHRAAQMRYPHWAVYETVVDDLHEYSRHVELHQANFRTFSVDLTRLYLSICSEIDVVLKMICEKVDPNAKRSNMDEYRLVVRKNYPNLASVRVLIRPLFCVICPWKVWKTGDVNPDWWRSYNNVKHQRNRYFAEANLQNVLTSAAALLVVLLFWYSEEISRNELGPDFRLFGFESDMWFLIQMGAHLRAEDLATVPLSAPPTNPRLLKQTLPEL